MYAHDVALGVIQDQPHGREAHHAVQALSDLMKQIREVAVRGDRLRYLQQGPVLLGTFFACELKVRIQITP